MAGQNSTVTPPADWYRDPLNRHEYRYWDGGQWSQHVSDGGQASVDLVAGPPAQGASGPWRRVPATKAVARRRHTATLLADGTVLIAGGSDGYGDEIYTPKASRTAVTYDPATGHWTDTGQMTCSRKGHTATLLTDGRVLVCGGLSMWRLESAELYDPASRTWQPTASMKTARFSDAVLLDDGRVLVCGGWEEAAVQDNPGGGRQWVSLASAEIYDPVSGTWSDAEAMQTARFGPGMTLLTDGRVLVVDGEDSAKSSTEAYESRLLTSAEVYEPASGTWSSAGMMQSERLGYTMTLLTDGRVLVAGMCTPRRVDPIPTERGEWASPELFDPVSGNWSATGTMTDIRRDHTATLLADGRVLVAGGYAAREHGDFDPTFDSSEVYDPSAGTWSAIAPMREKRAGHTATRLPDGRVLVAGGILARQDPDGCGRRAAEMFDPSTDRENKVKPVL